MTAKQVLVVEDDLPIRDIMQDVLMQAGYDVIPATSGKQAMEFLDADHAAPPDLIILDLMIPLVSGWQVLERIRGDQRLSGIPVIVTTAVTTDRPPGATVVLNKPFSVRALLEAITSTASTHPASAGL
jgi:two-component system response regulator CpxR